MYYGWWNHIWLGHNWLRQWHDLMEDSDWLSGHALSWVIMARLNMSSHGRVISSVWHSCRVHMLVRWYILYTLTLNLLISCKDPWTTLGHIDRDATIEQENFESTELFSVALIWLAFTSVTVKCWLHWLMRGWKSLWNYMAGISISANMDLMFVHSCIDTHA